MLKLGGLRRFKYKSQGRALQEEGWMSEREGKLEVWTETIEQLTSRGDRENKAS